MPWSVQQCLPIAMVLIWFCIAWLVGIVVGDRLQLPVYLTAGIAGMLAVLAAIWWPRRDVRLPLLIVTALLLGSVRIALAQPQTTEQSIWGSVGQSVAIEGFVAQQPDRREDRQSAVIVAERVELAGQSRVAEGLVRLSLPPVPELRYGQRLRVEGELALPRAGEGFDYRAYLARHGIYAVMDQPELQVVPGESGAWWQRMALHFNDHVRQIGLQLVSEPHASLLLGIVLGVQSTIPPDVLQAFEATGTSHILVLSGWNISVIIVGITGLLARLGVERKRAAGICLPMIAIYVLFVGMSASVVRAAVMGSLAVFAILVDRESEAWTSLLIACVAMTLPDPNVLWDIGFQLSALATAGLFAFARPIEGWLTARRPFCWCGLRWSVEPLTATLAASALSLPIILYHFGNLSLIAPLANILTLPVVPYAMLFGALAILGGILSMSLGQALALLAWPFLEWMLTAADWLARVPGAHTTVGPFHVSWLWGYYALMAVLWLRPRRWTRSVEQPIQTIDAGQSID